VSGSSRIGILRNFWPLEKTVVSRCCGSALVGMPRVRRNSMSFLAAVMLSVSSGGFRWLSSHFVNLALKETDVWRSTRLSATSVIL
jgi:hypothetical protein